MKHLLDTCTLIYLLKGEKEKISDKARSVLDQVENSLYVSAVSLWEITIKYTIGKLPLKDEPGSWILDYVKKLGFKTLSIDPKHVLFIAKLPPHHKDPFDRLLIAQSFIEDFSIISPDHVFSQYQVSTLW